MNPNDANEAVDFIVNLCTEVIVNLAKNNTLAEDHLKVRIDMERLNTEPIFTLYNQSAVIGRIELKQIVNAAGTGFSMAAKYYINDFIKSIFTACTERFEVKDTKQIFILLHLKAIEGHFSPALGIYKDKQWVDTIPVREIFGNLNEQLL